MRLLFIGDSLTSLKPAKDSTIAMIRAAWRRGHDCWYCQPLAISLEYRNTDLTPRIAARWLKPEEKERTTAKEHPASDIALSWAKTGHETWLSHKDLDLVIMRKDPPFDEAFFAATQMLTALEHAGLPVINRPSALRDHGEKMAVLEFAPYAVPGLVSSSITLLKDFAKSHEKVVYKPLDAMGGAGVFVTALSDPNLPVMLEMLTQNGARAIMAQRYLPEIVQGDKRVLLIHGEPVPYCLARIPPEGASRGNLAAGGRGVAQPLNPEDEAIARAIGPVLASRGLFLVGLDIIGNKLTEINVTSPTGFQEISAQTPANVGDLFISSIERTFGP